MRRQGSIKRSAKGGNLLRLLPRLGKKDCEIIKVAMEKCGPNPISERELPLLGHKRAIAAVRTLSKVCGYGTTAIHATLKKLMR
jgi:hypothetical protein